MPPDRMEIPPAHVSNAQLFLMLQQINTKQSVQMLRQQEQQQQLDSIKQEMKHIVAAWNTLGWLVTALKYTAAVVAAVTVVYYGTIKAVKEGIEWFTTGS